MKGHLRQMNLAYMFNHVHTASSSLGCSAVQLEMPYTQCCRDLISNKSNKKVGWKQTSKQFISRGCYIGKPLDSAARFGLESWPNIKERGGAGLRLLHDSKSM